MWKPALTGISIYQYTIPLQNPLQEKSSDIAKNPFECHEDPAEVEITNPAHPLFGRRFPLISMSRPAQGFSHVFVVYREEMILRIPLDDTNLGETRPRVSSMLTLHAIEAVITIAKECEEQCLINLTGSGMDCQRDSRTRSKKN